MAHLVGPVQCRQALRAQYGAKPGMESRRLSRGRPRPLRRMPHAAQSAAGARQSPQIRRRGQAGWRAYNITGDRDSGVGAWSDAELAQYLSTGHADGHGTASGPMGEAVDLSLQLSDAGRHCRDRRPICAPSRRSRPRICPRLKAEPAPASHRGGRHRGLRSARQAIFEGACASCHGWTGVSPLNRFATLTGARAVNDPSATNVAAASCSRARDEAQPGRRCSCPLSAAPIRTTRSPPSRTTSRPGSVLRARPSRRKRLRRCERFREGRQTLVVLMSGIPNSLVTGIRTGTSKNRLPPGAHLSPYSRASPAFRPGRVPAITANNSDFLSPYTEHIRVRRRGSASRTAPWSCFHGSKSGGGACARFARP